MTQEQHDPNETIRHQNVEIMRMLASIQSQRTNGDAAGSSSAFQSSRGIVASPSRTWIPSFTRQRSLRGEPVFRNASVPTGLCEVGYVTWGTCVY